MESRRSSAFPEPHAAKSYAGCLNLPALRHRDPEQTHLPLDPGSRYAALHASGKWTRRTKCTDARTRDRKIPVRQPLAAGAILHRAGARSGRLARENGPGFLRIRIACLERHRVRRDPRHSRADRSDPHRFADRDRDFFRLREFRLAHRCRRTCRLAGMDGENRLYRPQAQTSIVDRGDLRDPALARFHGREEYQRPRALVVCRDPSCIRRVGLAAGADRSAVGACPERRCTYGVTAACPRLTEMAGLRHSMTTNHGTRRCISLWALSPDEASGSAKNESWRPTSRNTDM